MASISYSADGVTTRYSLPPRRGNATVLVNGAPASIAQETETFVVLTSAPAIGSTLAVSGSIFRKISKRFQGSSLFGSVVDTRSVVSKTNSGSISSAGSVSNGPVIPNVPDETAPVLLSFLRRFIGRR